MDNVSLMGCCSPLMLYEILLPNSAQQICVIFLFLKKMDWNDLNALNTLVILTDLGYPLCYVKNFTVSVISYFC